MSQCVVPKWNLRQEQVEVGEESNRSSHVLRHSHSHSHHRLLNPTTHLFPMSNDEVAELTWENGQIAMHGLGGLTHPSQTKAAWGQTNETLESIVHQATCHKQNSNSNHHQGEDIKQAHHQPMVACSTTVASSAGKWAEISPGHQTNSAPSSLMKKRTRSDQSNLCATSFNRKEHMDLSACASASATFCRDSDTTMMTWASFASHPPPTSKAKTRDDDSDSLDPSENQDEDRETKNETVKSHYNRRTRAAAVHNQSERRRRDRINQKMKALQKLVPNASKTDKASMLDEVIEYLKQLQAQVHVMSVRPMPQMMMPLGMQHQLQMSLLARMGMGVGLGMGMGMLDMSTVPHSAPQSLIYPTPGTASAPTFLPSPFLLPSMIPPPHGPAPPPNQDPSAAVNNSSVPLPDPYYSFLPQHMNMDLYNKMAALYRHQANQTIQATSSQPQPNNVQRDR